MTESIEVALNPVVVEILYFSAPVASLVPAHQDVAGVVRQR